MIRGGKKEGSSAGLVLEGIMIQSILLGNPHRDETNEAPVEVAPVLSYQ